jgi:hypothetical protein
MAAIRPPEMQDYRQMANRVARLNKIALVGAVCAAALASGSAQAATQGNLGGTSTGTVTITASVPNRARITNLSDVSFLSQDPSTAASNAQNVCAWSNTALKNYTVTATGDGASSAFTLAGGAATVPYSVQWSGSSGATSGTALTSGTASAAFTSTATNQNCASGPATSASLIVGIGTADLGTMVAATTYTGVLTLVLTPQ